MVWDGNVCSVISELPVSLEDIPSWFVTFIFVGDVSHAVKHFWLFVCSWWVNFCVLLDSFLCICQNLNSFNLFLILNCYLIFTKHEPVLAPAESSFPLARWEKLRLCLEWPLEKWIGRTNCEECGKSKYACDWNPSCPCSVALKLESNWWLQFPFSPREIKSSAKDCKDSHVTEGYLITLTLWLFYELLLEILALNNGEFMTSVFFCLSAAWDNSYETGLYHLAVET